MVEICKAKTIKTFTNMEWKIKEDNVEERHKIERNKANETV